MTMFLLFCFTKFQNLGSQLGKINESCLYIAVSLNILHGWLRYCLNQSPHYDSWYHFELELQSQW